jgi:hypothetical protein
VGKRACQLSYREWSVKQVTKQESLRNTVGSEKAYMPRTHSVGVHKPEMPKQQIQIDKMASWLRAEMGKD